MKIIAFNPIYAEFGRALYATKDTPLTVVCDMTVQDADKLTKKVGVMFELHPDRNGFSFPFVCDRGIHDAFKRNIENKDALNVAKKILAEMDESHRCFDAVNGYVNFDKLAR